MQYIITQFTPYHILAIFFALGYLSGSVPYGLVLGKFMGLGDIRKSGSGNIGATNALRVGGKKLGILTLLCDFLKAFLPVLLARLYFNMDAAVFIGLGAVFGHLFPVWLKFKGGKGVASSSGVIVGLVPMLGAILIATWLAVAFISKYSSLSAITAAAIAPVAAWFITCNPQVTIVITLLAVILIIKHHENIRRLIKGEESKINLNKKKE